MRDSSRSNVSSGCVCQGVLEEISIQISRPSKDHPHHWIQTSFHQLRAYREQKAEKEQIPSLSLSWDTHLFLQHPLGHWALSSQVFRLGQKFKPLTSSHFLLLPLPNSQALGLRLNYTTSSPGSSTYRWQIWDFLTFIPCETIPNMYVGFFGSITELILPTTLW